MQEYDKVILNVRGVSYVVPAHVKKSADTDDVGLSYHAICNDEGSCAHEWTNSQRGATVMIKNA